MRLLARAEAERLGFVVGDTELRDMARWFRLRHGLGEFEPFAAFLFRTGLDLARFHEAMRDFALLARVLEHHRAAVDAELPVHLALHTVHEPSQGGRP